MSKKKILLMILPAVLVGALVFSLYNKTTGTTKIVVAKDIINAGMVITEDMLTTMEVPNTAIPKDALTNPENAVGKSVLYTRAPGDIILRSALSERENPVLKEGEAFVAIELPEALAGFVSEGSLLTVVEHLSATEMSGNVQTTVSAEGQTVEASGTVQAQATPQSVENLPVYSIIDLSNDTQTRKYAIVKTDKETAKRLVNVLARDHSVIITQ